MKQFTGNADGRMRRAFSERGETTESFHYGRFEFITILAKGTAAAVIRHLRFAVPPRRVRECRRFINCAALPAAERTNERHEFMTRPTHLLYYSSHGTFPCPRGCVSRGRDSRNLIGGYSGIAGERERQRRRRGRRQVPYSDHET